MQSRLVDLLALSYVPRWSVVPHCQPQSVADHSFRVAIICIELCQTMGHSLSAAGLFYALTHDGAESRSGDIPGPFKRLLNDPYPQHTANAESKACLWASELPAISDVEQSIIKLADLIEAYTFIKMYGIGRHASRVADSVRRHIDEAMIAANNATGKSWLLVTERLIAQILSEEGRP